MDFFLIPIMQQRPSALQTLRAEKMGNGKGVALGMNKLNIAA
jgi:hypothetical protein